MDTEQARSTLDPVRLSTSGTVIFVGHARLPQSLAPRDSSPVVSVELETDTSSGEIVCVGAKAIPDLGARLLTSVLVGHNINESPLSLVEEIRRRYICPSQKAMSTAVLNAFEAYGRYREAGLHLSAARDPTEQRRRQGLESVLKGEHTSANDYPELANELKGIADIADLLRESGRERRRFGEDMRLLHTSDRSSRSGQEETGARFS